MQTKSFAILLFTSLGLNVFLGGLWVGSRFNSHHERHRDPHAHLHSAPDAPPEKMGVDPEGRKGRIHRGHDSDRDRGGPEELVILRRMVRVMGGPDDPRVREIRDESRDEIRDTRQEMRAARQEVQAALTVEPFDEAALAEALRTLNETGTAGRSRAQEALVHLASQMTAEERVALRRQVASAGRDEKNGRPDKKGDPRGPRPKKKRD